MIFDQIRDSFGDNEESCLLPLQEKYLSTVITPTASTRQEKNTFVSCSESAGSSSCTTPSTATNLKIPNVPVKKVSHHTSPPTTREVAYLDHQGSVQYKTVPSPNQSSDDEHAGKLFNLTGSKKKDFSTSTTQQNVSFCGAGEKESISAQAPYHNEMFSMGLSQHPKMRVVQPPRGAIRMYSTTSSSSSSVASSNPESHKSSSASHARKRNYIIFDENDEDTLI